MVEFAVEIPENFINSTTEDKLDIDDEEQVWQYKDIISQMQMSASNNNNYAEENNPTEKESTNPDPIGSIENEDEQKEKKEKKSRTEEKELGFGNEKHVDAIVVDNKALASENELVPENKVDHAEELTENKVDRAEELTENSVGHINVELSNDIIKKDENSEISNLDVVNCLQEETEDDFFDCESAASSSQNEKQNSENTSKIVAAENVEKSSFDVDYFQYYSGDDKNPKNKDENKEDLGTEKNIAMNEIKADSKEDADEEDEEIDVENCGESSEKISLPLSDSTRTEENKYVSEFCNVNEFKSSFHYSDKSQNALNLDKDLLEVSEQNSLDKTEDKLNIDENSIDILNIADDNSEIIEKTENTMGKDESDTRDEFRSVSSSSNNGDMMQKIDDFVNAKFSDEDDNSGSTQSSTLPTTMFASNQDDDVRNQLRQQLNLLRTKKKPVSLLGTQRVAVVAPIMRFKRKKTPPPPAEPKVPKFPDFQIVSVVGGVPENYLEDNENVSDVDSQQELNSVKEDSTVEVDSSADNSTLIKPTKTKDVCKIKGWKMKKFSHVFAERIAKEKLVPNERRLLQMQDVVYKYDLKYGEPTAGCSKDTVEINVEYNNVPDKETLQDIQPLTPQVQIKQEVDIGVEQTTLNVDKQNDKKSAFVSDALDDFLSNKSALNISYEVPKLAAEDTISIPKEDNVVIKKSTILYKKFKVSKKITESAITPCNDINNTISNTQNKIKAKTLAEKRKLLEMEKRVDIKKDMEAENTEMMEKLEKTKSIDGDAKKILLDNNVPFTKQCWALTDQDQYILFNGTKVYVTTSTVNQQGQICEIITKRNRPARLPKGYFYENEEVKLKPAVTQLFKSGPLSKKKTTSPNEEAVIKKLPSVKLEIYPEIGKSLPTPVENLLMVHSFHNVVDFARASLAVSAVVTKSSEEKKHKEKFVFDVPYSNGQTQILLRRKKSKTNKTESNEIIQKEKVDQSESPVSLDIRLHEDSVPSLINTQFFEDKTICNIVEKMVDYVAKKEEFDNIVLQHDEEIDDQKDSDSNSLKPPSPLPSMVSTIIKQQGRRGHRKKAPNKTSLELKRLNVQFIEVNVEDKEDVVPKPTMKCEKEFCKMGCLCNSLQASSNNIFKHCGRIECMFKCSCDYETKETGHHKVTLPAGTDVLSAGTMVRLEDEAKRHLAKEEKKFTQTVIRANNQTIVVGSGLRDRSKRLSKVPAKYQDHVSSTLSELRMYDRGLPETQPPPLKIKEYVKPKLWKQEEDDLAESSRFSKTKQRAIEKAAKRHSGIHQTYEDLCRESRKRNLVIKVERLPINNLIPFCMIHKFYRCKCGLKAPPIPEIPDNDPENLLVPYKVIRLSKDSASKLSFTTVPSSSVTFTKKSEKPGPSQMTRAELLMNTCARTRAISKVHYVERNASETYRKRYKQLKDQQKQREIDAYMFLKKHHEQVRGVVEGFTPQQMKEKIEQMRKSPNKNATLPSLSESDSTEFSSISSPTNTPSATLSSLIDFTTSDSLLLKPTKKLMSEFHQMLGLKEKIPFRLLGWKHLLRRYKDKTLHLWYSGQEKGRLIITESTRKPHKTFVAIQDYVKDKDPSKIEQDVIRFLITDKIPNGAKNPEDIFVVLAFTNYNWEIKGIFERKVTSTVQTAATIPQPSKCSDVTLSVLPGQKKVSLGQEQESEANSSVSKNNDTNKPEKRGIQLCKYRFNLLELRSDVGSSVLLQKSGIQVLNQDILKARLPQRPGKWWVVPMENTFSILQMPSSFISMKYTELEQLVQISKKCGMTIHVRGSTKQNRKPDCFGIFAVPDVNDKIFIGPYGQKQKLDCDFLKYMGDNLVNAELYANVKEDVNSCRLGKWFYQTSVLVKDSIPKLLNKSVSSDKQNPKDDDIEVIKDNPVVIDLTDMDDEHENTTSVSENKPIQRKRKQSLVPMDQQPYKKLNKDSLSNTIATSNNRIYESNPPSPNEMILIGFDNNETKEMCHKLKNVKNNIVKKYFITNIVNLGYIEAWHDKNTNHVDVNWPLTSEFWKFKKIDIAVRFIKELLKRRVLFFPENYPVEVILVDQLPPCQKLNADYLNGFHMVTFNQLFDIRNMQYADFLRLGLDEGSYLNMIKKKCFAILNQEAKALGQTFLSPERLKSTPNSQIVDLAVDEVRKLQKIEQRLIHNKMLLAKDKEDLIIKYGTLIEPLPQERKIIANRILHQILRISNINSNSAAGHVKEESSEIKNLLRTNSTMQREQMPVLKPISPVRITSPITVPSSPPKIAPVLLSNIPRINSSVATLSSIPKSNSTTNVTSSLTSQSISIADLKKVNGKFAFVKGVLQNVKKKPSLLRVQKKPQPSSFSGDASLSSMVNPLAITTPMSSATLKPIRPKNASNFVDIENIPKNIVYKRSLATNAAPVLPSTTPAAVVSSAPSQSQKVRLMDSNCLIKLQNSSQSPNLTNGGRSVKLVPVKIGSHHKLVTVPVTIGRNGQSTVKLPHGVQLVNSQATGGDLLNKSWRKIIPAPVLVPAPTAVHDTTEQTDRQDQVIMIVDDGNT